MPSALGYVGVSDVVDVIATAILIYYVLLLIRGTRAVQILTGILVLVGLLGIATLFHLYLSGTILRLLVVGAAVTIPIVFQPELRRALEQLGRGGLFRLESPAEESMRVRTEDPTIAVLGRTAFLLGRARRGALIVLEQQSGLKEYAESGTMLERGRFRGTAPDDLYAGITASRRRGRSCATDASKRPAALAPLGAVADEDRIGTRHRAALGLTEQTDAVVLVVSEQTGAITIARGGVLTRPVEEEQRLVKMLLAVTRPPRAHRRHGDFIGTLRSRFKAPRGEPTSRSLIARRGNHPPKLCAQSPRARRRDRRLGLLSLRRKFRGGLAGVPTALDSRQRGQLWRSDTSRASPIAKPSSRSKTNPATPP